MADDLIQTVISCEIDHNELVIRYQNELYHRLCLEVVTLDEPTTRCVKRIGHLSNIHEDWMGQTAVDQPSLFD